MAFSPDGLVLAVGSRAQGTVQLRDARTHQQLATLEGHSRSSTASMAFSPDGKTLATTGSLDRTVWLWDVQTHQQLATLTSHTGYVQSVAFSPDGRTLATGDNSGAHVAVGRGNPPIDCQAHRPRGHGVVPGFQPGRNDPGQRR